MHPAVIAWASGKRHERPPFGDNNQMRVAFEKRREAFWAQLSVGDAHIATWPEFQRMVAGLHGRRENGVRLVRVRLYDYIVDNFAILEFVAQHLTEDRFKQLVRGVLVRARVRMKSCAVEPSTNVKLWETPGAIRSALNILACEGFDALACEVARVKALPANTKRAVKQRELAKKALRLQILEFARHTFEGESLELITMRILDSLKVRSKQSAPVISLQRAA